MNNLHLHALCLVLFLAVWCPAIGLAQVPSFIVKPEAVRLAPPSNAKWSIRIQPVTEELPDNGEIPKQEKESAGVSTARYVLTGRTGRATIRHPEGKDEQIYFYKEGGNTLFLRYLEKARRVVPYLLDAYLTEEFRFSESYPGVGWVRKEDYHSTVEFRGELCHWFVLDPQEDNRKEETEASIAYNPRFSPNRREAWFSAKTGLPVAFRSGTAEGSFSHEEPPESTIKLPKPYFDALQYYYGVGQRPQPHSAPEID